VQGRRSGCNGSEGAGGGASREIHVIADSNRAPCTAAAAAEDG
jgi:hypothetical protein